MDTETTEIAATRTGAQPCGGVHALTLIHYSAKPLKLQNAHPHAGRDAYFKPRGLWVSVKGPDDWASWCESEGFGPDRMAYASRIVLSGSANILHLSGAWELDDFTMEFRLDPPQYAGDKSIDWPRVQKRYNGIIIAPYCWSRRMTDHTFWYYGWDCASGCIWNANVISQVVSQGAEHCAAAGNEVPGGMAR